MCSTETGRECNLVNKPVCSVDAWGEKSCVDVPAMECDVSFNAFNFLILIQ